MPEQHEIPSEINTASPDNDTYSSLLILRDSIEQLDRRLGSPVMSTEAKAKLEVARNKLAEQYDTLRIGLMDESEDEPDMHEVDRNLKLRHGLKELRSKDATDELLQEMGMLDKDGKLQYPENLFSAHTDHLWEQYLKAVRAHMDEVKRAKESHETDNSRLKALDVVRISKHDEFTRSLIKDFGVENNTENFDLVRRLAAKMRDSIVPGSGETALTAKYVRGLVQKQIDELERREVS